MLHVDDNLELNDAIVKANPSVRMHRRFHAFSHPKLGADETLILFRSPPGFNVLPIITNALNFHDSAAGRTDRDSATTYTIVAKVGSSVTVTWSKSDETKTVSFVVPKTTRVPRCDIPYPCGGRTAVKSQAFFFCEICGSCQHIGCAGDAGFCMRCETEDEIELSDNTLENGWFIALPA